MELSAAGYVDSIYFELVTATGQLLQTIGYIKSASNNNLYHQLANDVPSGTSYWRVRIKLKSGATVYTEIISVLTTGKRFILFYPNPSRRDDPLIYVLQQGIPTDSRLQLYDISGRVVKSFTELPDRINISKLPPGMLIYKLYSNDKKLLETGKLMIQ